MVGTGLLAMEQGALQPASDGWEFVESSRIYSNIGQEPVGITLVDAESGVPIAKVAGLSEQGDGVRLRVGLV